MKVILYPETGGKRRAMVLPRAGTGMPAVQLTATNKKDLLEGLAPVVAQVAEAEKAQFRPKPL